MPSKSGKGKKMTERGTQILNPLLSDGSDRGEGARSTADQPTLTGTLASFAGFGQLLAAPGFPIAYLCIIWMGPRLGGSVRFRQRDGWGPWQPMVAGDSSRSDLRTALISAGGAQAYQITPPPRSEVVEIVAINTSDGAVGAPGRVPARPLGEFAPGIPFLERHGWGADESLRNATDGRSTVSRSLHPAQTLTVHHTSTPNFDPDPAATVRAICFFHSVAQGFGDIGYHLLIDEQGVVYQGQWSPRPDEQALLGQAPAGLPTTSGAHVGGYNAGNIGISLLGDFTKTQPTPMARRSLVRVLASLAGSAGIDPLGHVAYVNPISEATKDVPAIAAHGDWSFAGCPGETFSHELPSVRIEAAKILAQSSLDESPRSAGRRQVKIRNASETDSPEPMGALNV